MPARPIPHAWWLIVALALGVAAPSASAQDIEMLGRRYGTQPPAGYFQELARDPEAFRFTRGRAEPARMLEAARSMQAGTSVRAFGAGAPARALGPRDPVLGTYRIPMLLGLYSDPSVTAPYTRQQVQTAFFDAATGTVTEYYDEVSGGDLDLVGVTQNWVRSTTHTQSAVTQGQSALVCCGIGDFIKNLISLQGGVDWGMFDNDGPDGVPNSGDDDGYVDALAVMHPHRGAECGGAGSADRIWSHKWNLSDASTTGQAYVTTSPRNGGGFIGIEDYFVQGLLSCPAGPPRPCDPECLNEIGVFAHEAGHAFGLPDLYDTRVSGTRHSGAGNWEVMSHGTWGCNDRTPERPCHMSAWSKAMLGWVDVITLAPDMDHGVLTLPPVETARVVYRVDAQDGSGEYFLLENRRSLAGTYDEGLLGEGLFVWHIDANALAERWTSNLVNAYDDMAVWLRQADGAEHLNELFQSPGDPGDPFPGGTGNTAFHAVSLPSSNSRGGNPSGLTLFDIQLVGDDVDLHALTRFTRLTVRSVGATASGLFTVDGDALPGPPPHVVLSPPFTSRTIEAAIGEIVVPGERRPFLQWNDAPSATRTRIVTTPVVDTDYEAAFGGIQYQLAIPLAGGINGVTPGVITTTPASSDLWFAPNTVVNLSIAPRTGFSFLDWTQGLAGQPNPTTITLDSPVFGGADFELTYAVADLNLPIPAAVAQDLQLVAANGTPPIFWSVVAGSLPPGIGLSEFGRLTGAAVAAGVFPATVEAADGIGLTDQANIDFQVADPTLPIEGLASRFLLSGAAIDQLQEAYVDHHGNGNGAYDLGDFRAWVLAHPNLPMSASIVASPRASIVAVPLAPAAAAGTSTGGRP